MRVFVSRMYILGILFVLLGALNTFVGYRHLEGRLRSEMEQSISARLDQILAETSSHLFSASRALQAAELMVELEEDRGKIAQFFDEILQNNPSFLAMYLGVSPTDVVYVNRAFTWEQPVDPTTRPWYQAAVREGRLIVTDPYVDAAQGSLVLTMAQPIHNHAGELLGVVGVDQSLTQILALLDQAKPSEKGLSLAFDSTGQRLLHPGEENATAGSSLLEQGVMDRLLTESRGVVFTRVEGRDGYLRWEALEGSGLIIAAFAPMGDFLDGRALALRTAGTTAVALALFWLLITAFQRRYIIKPITELDRDIAAIPVTDDIAYRLPLPAQDPFGDLRAAVNAVLVKAQEHFEEVTYQQEELSAAYSQLMAHERQLQAQYAEIKEQDAQIRFLAEHDALTGLFNRQRFEKDLKTALEAGEEGSLLLLDVDDFKRINDTQGHVYGDGVLRRAGQELVAKLGSGARVYRFAGDEFLILTREVLDQNDAERIGQELTFLWEGGLRENRRIRLTMSAGVVRFPQDGSSVDELLSKADLALHRAKGLGKNRVLLFEGRMAADFARRVEVETILRRAVENGAFNLVYQPVVDGETGEIVYFEALLRLQEQPISPSVFIAIAEEVELINPIGRWVMGEALAQLAKWREAGLGLKPISINLSPKQFYDDGLVEFLVSQLELRELQPSLIEMEITESVLIDNPDQAIKIIQHIKDMGIRMALDDFGTGYLGLNYITNLPVDRIKLDRSLSADLTGNLEVVKGLITMAHGLGLEVVAEGVEHEADAEVLQRLGCNYLQGYLFSRPVPAGQIEQMLRS